MSIRLTDDAYGEISSIFLAVPKYAIEQFSETLRRVYAALPRDATLDILAAPESIDAVRSWTTGRSGETRLHMAPADMKFTHWTRDALFTGTSHNAEVALISDIFERDADRDAAEILAEAAGWTVRKTHLPIDGGNILVAGQQVLVGADVVTQGSAWLSLDHSLTLSGVGADRARKQETEIPSDMLPAPWRECQRTGMFGKGTQPLYHLDLYIAPAGRSSDGQPRWLLGCPRLGADLLGLPLLEHADAELFDEAAARLSATGAEVIRNPMPLFWSDRKADYVRTWQYLPVNNVLVEITTSGSARVWMPCFSQAPWRELAKIDDANASIWKDLGFDVTQVPDCLPLAERRGALRCMCNIVRRSH